jgi:DNA-binding beta-propeller fold protein YncE
MAHTLISNSNHILRNGQEPSPRRVRVIVPSADVSVPRRFLAICLLLTLFLILSPPQAHADGGAPNLAYVSGTAHGISVIDILQQKVSRTIAVDGDPHTLSLDGRFLYVTQPAVGRVAVIAARTGQPFCTADLPGHPTLLALGTDTTTLYAADNEGNISAVDSTTCTVRETFKVHGGVYGLAVAGISTGNNTLSDQLWVAGTDALLLFNEMGQELASVPIAGGPQSLCILAGMVAYVTTRQGTVVAVDQNTLQVSPPLLTGGKFGTMDYDAVTLEVYVPDQKAKQIDVLAPFTMGVLPPPHEPERVIRLSASPQAVAISSDGQFAFVALSGGAIAMLDLPARRTIKTLTVGGTPHFIIIGLYPPPGNIVPLRTAVSPVNIALVVLFSALAVGALLAVLWFVWRQHKKA